MLTQTFAGIALLLGASLIWGLSYIPTRYLGSQNIGVFTELSVRYATPFLIFGIMHFKNIIKTPREVIKNSFITGLVLFIAIICSVYGIRITQYGSVGIMILSLNVVFVPLYFALFSKQKLPTNLIIATSLSFIGALLLMIDAPAGEFNIGILLCFIASIGYTIYIILCSKLLSNDTHPAVFQFYQALIFVIVCIPIALTNSNPQMINWDNNWLWVSLGFIALFSGTIAYQLFFYGQKISHPIVTTLILASQTVFSALGDVLFFKINLTFMQVIAYICICIGVFIVPFRIGKKS